MSDRLDDRIRELYAELTGAAPDVPPLPATRPARSRDWMRPTVVAVAAGLAALVLVVGVGVGLLGNLGEEGDEEASATLAPSAPETVVAAGEDEPSGEPRPVERILLLADINRLCGSARDLLARDLTVEPASRADYLRDLDAIANAVFPIRELTRREADGSDDAALAAAADRSLAVLQVTEEGPGDDPAVAQERLEEALGELALLENALVELGAADCSGLTVEMP